ncbi:hypothetical protein PG997_000618 [Apiospora hydei]|uniref:Myb-like DNA-binding domain-containing protein n=1 Tax=Apiospora hydei TaxID=1337664 RepID=A0ABR1XBG7_9PEZI
MSANANTMPKATDGEVRFLLLVLKNMKTPIPVEWDAVAEDGGYNSINTAKARLSAIKRRLSVLVSSSPAKAPGKIVKRSGQSSSGGRAKRAKTQHDGYDDLDDIEDFDLIKKEEEDDRKFIVVDEA